MREDAILKKKIIGFIGAGNMGEALVKGLLGSKKVKPAQIIVCDPLKKKLQYMSETYRIAAERSNCDVVRKADIIILAVKPIIVAKVLEEIKRDLSKEKLLISIAAGVTTHMITGQLLHRSPVIRVMPNTPAIVQEGASALFMGENATKDAEQTVIHIFNSIGESVVIDDERLMDVVTGLSGSGPAFVFLFIEALADGGVKMGLKREIAFLLAVQTVFGASMLVKESTKHLGELKDMVTSPGGTTIAGLHILEKKGMRGVVMEAVEVATKRSRELSQ
jgi:pyrroline-5-carboxylate reductase